MLNTVSTIICFVVIAVSLCVMVYLYYRKNTRSSKIWNALENKERIFCCALFLFFCISILLTYLFLDEMTLGSYLFIFWIIYVPMLFVALYKKEV